ncbi:XTP/dITP diphosphatase [Metabacillus litoralis]|jgi:XTP/dITP diphosphohydrolase|uniref:XTP/dITP diphosphatase n=1 Tax=Metabacillus litoralis TaxID=152268 RepID=UPI00203BD410|nr:XTP/dITP diphosphatase [Metabacillus litoralis]MCM3651443.1 XTP/dITP diphosphatase [Metabacillus litoralis]
MKNIWIATNNAGKASEFQEMFSKLGYSIKTLNDLDDPIEIEENGRTFEENARIKAETLSKIVNEPVLADDSGLMIDQLNGAPGVYSARYTGTHKSDADNIQKVLDELKNTPKEQRTCRFVCVLAISRPHHETLFFKGTCEGEIAFEASGTNGFGYDPIFFLPEIDQTMAHLSKSEKSKISHRGNAIKQLESKLNDLF